METYKSPLSLYVLWHPDSVEGKTLAENVYNTFCRNYKMPLARHLGIPTFFRTKYPNGAHTPINIPLDEADRNAIVVLIDEFMLNDEYWATYIENIARTVKKRAADRIYPVALHKYSTAFCEDIIGRNQFIKLDIITSEPGIDAIEVRTKQLRNRLLHDLSRQMLNQKSVAEANSGKSEDLVPAPVKLFISHAKRDGLQIATQFRNYINSETKLKTFFDANDIADSYDFDAQIKSNIDERTALIVFHTDDYSDREWCRIEIIEAKRIKAPIVVVTDIVSGEKRSFPYLGNVPTIKWNTNFEDIVELTLLQVLNNRYSDEYLKKHVAMHKLNERYECIELTTPPELFNYLLIVKLAARLNSEGSSKEIIVVYPDPPLGSEELDILNEIDDKIHFSTPTYTFRY